MLQTTFSLMRQSLGRHVAAGLAIVLGTAFVAATLVGGRAMEEASYATFEARYGQTDLVVSTGYSDDVEIQEQLSRFSENSFQYRGIETSTPMFQGNYAEISNGARSEWVSVDNSSTDPRVFPRQVSTGVEPADDTDIALPTQLAERLNVAPGDSVTVDFEMYGTDGEISILERNLTVSGLIDDSGAGSLGSISARVATELFTDDLFPEAGLSTVAPATWVIVNEDSDTEDVASQILYDYPDLHVDTVRDLAQQSVSDFSGLSNPFLWVLLGFGLISLIVAGLVISNTFQVLIAQRTRTLALLRCVGADARQIRMSVRLEALLVGLTASAVGLIAGFGLIQAVSQVLTATDSQVQFTAGAHLNAQTVLITLGVGVLTTIAAANPAARAATSVSPLAALQPLDASVGNRHGRTRAVFASVAVILGLGGLALAAVIAGESLSLTGDQAVMVGLLLGVFSGLVTLTGILLGTVFVMPGLIRVMGRFGRTSVPWQVACENAVRNPRRTANTANALIIGVTLVSLFATGAASARATLNTALDEEFSVDLAVMTVYEADGYPALTSAQQNVVTERDEVESFTWLRSAMLDIDSSAPPTEAEVFALDNPDAALNSTAPIEGLTDSTILFDSWAVSGWNLEAGDMVTVGSGSNARELEVVIVRSELPTPLLTRSTLEAVSDQAPIVGVYARFVDGAAAMQAVSAVQSELTNLSDSADSPLTSVTGSAAMRQAIDELVNVMLLVVVGLLAVAVVIALIGVANTLSLSVLERRRESATLRALGLTKAQLRSMLAVEGTLIAGAAAIVGVVSGVIFGWFGTLVLLGTFGQNIELAIPWTQLAGVVLVAVIAGVLASVLPARSATKPSPVAALATE